MAEQERARAGRRVDAASIAVIVITLALFTAAVAVKGIGHELLLEAAVFLVSVKLILMAYRSEVANQHLLQELAAVRAMVADLQRQPSVRADPTAATSRQ